jgi:L-lactate dehydrogenase complex protein LldG
LEERNEMTPVYESNKRTVLDDVRSALGRRATLSPTPLDAFVESAAETDGAELIERFVQEATAVRAQVHRLSDERQVVDKILEICASQRGEIALSGAALFGKTDVHAELEARGLSIFAGNKTEHEQTVAGLASCAVGVTLAHYAIAETGTIVLSSDEADALLVSLLPPLHIALVRSEQMIATMDEALARIGRERMGQSSSTRSLTLITGPSRTSDVELVLSIGVHGPKALHVIILH